MIPKTIHYCWFGKKEMPKLAKKCIQSWKTICPDYNIICWNEENFNINGNNYVRQAYENKKYAFVTDYVRLWALYNYGGIYMDTDVEVLKSFDKFLELKAFSGFENDWSVPTGIMGSEKGLEIISELLKYYDNKSFLDNNKIDTTTNVTTITNIMLKKGLKLNNSKQEIEGFTFFPKEYFCPIDYRTKKKNITENTYTIHWFLGSWVSTKDKIKIRLYTIIKRLLGEERTNKLLNKIRGRKDEK